MSNHLAGTKIVLTGDFAAHSRNEAHAILEGLGADVTGSVSGKTMVVIVGEKPGSKVQKAEARGIPLIGEAEMLAMIAGKTLNEVLASADEPVEVQAPKLPFPFRSAPPRDGVYTTHFKGTQQIHVTGEYKDGLKTGSWKEFWPKGQLKQDYHWEAGLKHGQELDWKEDGTQVCKGVNRHHLREGIWTWWHKNGVLSHSSPHDQNGKIHGECKWFFEDGALQTQGKYHRGERHGEWEWHNGEKYERQVRGYYKGKFHGQDRAWFKGGQLAYKRTYVHAFKEGEEETYYEDGKPKSKGDYRHNLPVGTHLSWDESGKETSITYVNGLSEIPSDKKLASLAKRIAKARDHYAAESALEKVVDWGERAPLTYHLWKMGLYDITRDTKLWGMLKGASGLMSGQDVITFLKTSTNKDVYGGFLPYWAQDVDAIVMSVYARDPEPIDAAWESLPDLNKKGVAFVRARFGKDIGDVLADEMNVLAKHHATNYGLSERILWPNEDGQVVEQMIYVDFHKEPVELFHKLIAIFGTREQWLNGLRANVLQEDDGYVPDVTFSTFRQLIAEASVEEMISYCTKISLNGESHNNVHNALWHWRKDDGATMTKIALGIQDTGLRKWPAVCAAILKLAEEGKEIDQALVDAFFLDADSPTASSTWSSSALQKLPEELRSNPAMAAKVINMDIGAYVPRSQRIHQALTVLSQDQVREIFDRTLETNYYKTQVTQYLYLLDDPELHQKALEIAEADSNGHHARVTWGFGDIGLSILPALEAAQKRATTVKFREGWWQAIIVALTRAIVSGEAIPEEYDKHIRFDGMNEDYYYQFIRPLIERLLFCLPEERAEKILLKGLGHNKSTYWRALRMIAICPSEPVLALAFSRLLELESAMKYEQGQDLTQGLKGLPNGPDWVKWVLQSGGGKGCKEALKSSMNWQDFENLEKPLAEAGVEKPKELDAIDKIVEMAAEQGNKGEELYLLRRLETADGSDFNVIGGAAPGVFADRWPMFEEEPMDHLFTLDLSTMPQLQMLHKGARTISVFCASPGFNEAYEPGNAWTALVQSSEDQLKATGELPEDIETETEARFEVVSVMANVDNSEMRKAIYSCGARVMGDPMWLQGDDYFGSFLMQFDESFSYMNLGDMGIMYVFEDTAFWQCH